MEINGEWRTIQIFIEKELNNKDALEISEVAIDSDGPANIKCSCKNFKEIEVCKHVTYVTRKIEKNNGSFGLMVPEEIPDELAYMAFSDEQSARNFILHYGKIEVI
jgi:hypothetical protein